MPPGKHAKLSPSASERWLSCPASVRMAEKVPEPPDSPYAREGTLAHELAELKAGKAFNLITGRQYTLRRKKWDKEAVDFGLSPEALAEMEEHTDSYVALLAERMKAYPHSRLRLEQRLESGIPGCKGTSDAVIYSPTHIEVVDFKYGSGVLVSAIGNSQLRLYGCGALEAYGDILDTTEVVILSVFQPRCGDGQVSSEELSADELRRWREEDVRPVALQALGPDAPFGPSESACRWCPAAGVCRVRMETSLAEDFGTDPDVITPEEMAGVLERAPQIRDWLQAVHDAAMRRVYDEGQPLPGWKVVQGTGRRVISDAEKAYDLLVGAGHRPSDVAELGPKLKGLGVLDKVVGGKDALQDVLGTLLAYSEGKPALVKETDKREAIGPGTGAEEDFTDASIL